MIRNISIKSYLCFSMNFLPFFCTSFILHHIRKIFYKNLHTKMKTTYPSLDMFCATKKEAVVASLFFIYMYNVLVKVITEPKHHQRLPSSRQSKHLLPCNHHHSSTNFQHPEPNLYMHYH